MAVLVVSCSYSSVRQTSVKIGGTKFRKCTCKTGRPAAVSLSSGKKASCKACRVVDGIGLSAGMMSTVGLDLTNFLTPELTWKKGLKGNRSTRRRSKRPSWNMAVGGLEPANQNGETMDEKSVSESEKLGVAVLGRRFGNMIEHVPLKKRVTMFQSPSPPPPQTPSPQTEVSEQQQSHPNSPDKKLLLGTNFDGKTSEVSKEKTGFFEDFSGIEMLATAACEDTLIADICRSEDGQSLQGNDPAESLLPLKNTEVKIEVSPVQDNSIGLSDTSMHGEDEKNVDESATPRDNRLHWDLNVPMDAWEQPCHFENVPEDGSVDESKKLLTTCKIKVETQGIKLENLNGSSIPPGFGDLPVESVLGTEENKLEVCSSGLGYTLTEDAQKPSAGPEKSMEDNKSRPIEGSRVGLPCVSVIGNVTCETESTVLNEDTEKFVRDSIGEKVSINSFQSPEPVLDLPCYVKEGQHPNYENKFETPLSAVEGQHPLVVNTHTVEFDSPSRVSSGPTSSSGKVNKEDPSDVSCHSGGCHSGVYQNEKSNFVVENSMEQLQAGYDSQIEDGELREPYLRCWEENEEEDDTEFVDYGSECEEQCMETKMVDEKKMKVDGGLTPPGFDNLSSRTKHVEVTDSSRVMKHADDHMDKPNSSDYSSRLPGFKASTDRNRFDFGDSYPRAGRQTKDGSGFHMGEYNSYHGSYGPRRFRPKSDIEGRGYAVPSDRTFSESAGLTGFDRRTPRRPYLGSSNGFNRSFVRKRSPIDRHGGTYGGQPIREFSPDRPKFKRYQPQGTNRGIREEYHRPMPDDSSEYPKRFLHRPARRDRSLSPINGGRYYYKSRSRSRSHSPVPCVFPRERNEGSRNRSRSPRIMDKVRFPFQKRFVADCDDDDVTCGPRVPRFPNQRNSRWLDDRNNNGVDNSFRRRKSSPGGSRVLRPPSQRFDSTRRMNSDDYVRPLPVQQNRRFQEVADGGTVRGGYKYESSDDDRRKYGNNRYDYQRGRRYDTDGGPVRRFQYKSEESFPANDS
ncbi:hypothetical protein ACFE04_028874 [Oxalis oulophora]